MDGAHPEEIVLSSRYLSLVSEVADAEETATEGKDEEEEEERQKLRRDKSEQMDIHFKVLGVLSNFCFPVNMCSPSYHWFQNSLTTSVRNKTSLHMNTAGYSARFYQSTETTVSIPSGKLSTALALDRSQAATSCKHKRRIAF